MVYELKEKKGRRKDLYNYNITFLLKNPPHLKVFLQVYHERQINYYNVESNFPIILSLIE